MKNQRGFQLIELMIVISVLAILSTLAYPTFTDVLYKARRTDGQLALLDLQNTLISQGPTAHINPTSPQGYYALSIEVLGENQYQLTATPQKQQANDPCGPLTLNHLQQKGALLAECW